MRKIIAFDLDNTLAESKSQISDEMATLLGQLLERYDVCIISGGRFEQFQKQVISQLAVDGERLVRLHIMPTCGTRYMRYDPTSDDWKLIYHNNLSADQKKRVLKVLEAGAKKLGLWVDEPYGEIIEDRESQITYSALGQDIADMLGEEGLKRKYAWDPDMKKREALRDLIAPELPDLEVRVGGITSLDITLPGVDKAYGMTKLIEQIAISKDDILFVGDMLQEGGNDYPVKKMGIDCIEVSGYLDTPHVVRGIIGASV